MRCISAERPAQTRCHADRSKPRRGPGGACCGAEAKGSNRPLSSEESCKPSVPQRRSLSLRRLNWRRALIGKPLDQPNRARSVASSSNAFNRFGIEPLGLLDQRPSAEPRARVTPAASLGFARTRCEPERLPTASPAQRDVHRRGGIDAPDAYDGKI